MAGTITASMAGELTKKAFSPISSSSKNTDEKINKLADSIESLKKRLDPESKDFANERDLLVDRFKDEIGFDDFSIKDQKILMGKINKNVGASYNILSSIQKDLNNTSSLLYKTMSKNISNVMSAPFKAMSFWFLLFRLIPALALNIVHIFTISSLYLSSWSKE